jgi:hypothetical protein
MDVSTLIERAGLFQLGERVVSTGITNLNFGAFTGPVFSYTKWRALHTKLA